MDRAKDNQAPELDNSEQEDDGQAQDIAEEILSHRADRYEESEHGGRSNPAAILPDDAPDLIDKMEEMLTSGRIDNGAFEGEPAMDDEEDTYGETDRESDELA